MTPNIIGAEGMKYYSAQLVIKEKGTKNKIKLTSKRLSEKAIEELEALFIREQIYDPSYQVRQEMLEGIEKAKISLQEARQSHG